MNNLKDFFDRNPDKTVSWLSKKTKISERNIYRILAGTIDPRHSTLKKISSVTGLALDKIVRQEKKIKKAA